MSELILTNQFGEVSLNQVGSESDAPLSQGTVQSSPAKSGVTALSPLAGDAVLTVAVTQLNALLAALKAIV